MFVVEKKSLDQYTRRERDDILETLKEGVVRLTKIRHPRVLTVQHPLEESRDSIAFATEPIFASLANVLGDRHNVPPAAVQANALRNFRLHEVEIKTGLLQLAEALAFLHTDARLLHRNVCPTSVVINKEGGWKLFGFEYSVTASAPSSSGPAWSFRPYQQAGHPLLQPSLDYLAPEHICAESNEPASDLYSLAILICTLHSTSHAPPTAFADNIDAFRRYATDLEHGGYPNMATVPPQLADHVRLSLNSRPSLRPAVHELSRCAFFDDVRVKTLHYLDTTFQWTNLQKSKFYKGLPAVLAQMPARVQRQHVLPALIREFANAAMIPFVLPAYFHIAAECSTTEYAQLMHEPLRPVLRLAEPIQILLTLVQHIELLLRQTPPAALQSDVLPVLYRAIESDQPQMQQMCLSVLPAFARAVDAATVRTGILPRIRALCTAPAAAAPLVVMALRCLGHLLEHMDRWLVLDEVVPLLMQVRTRDGAVVAAVVAVLRLVMDSSRLGVGKDVMAQKLVPFLMPLCVEGGLSVPQFDAVVAMVREMVELVVREQRTKLEQLSGVQATVAATDGEEAIATMQREADAMRVAKTATTKAVPQKVATATDWTNEVMVPKVRPPPTTSTAAAVRPQAAAAVRSQTATAAAAVRPNYQLDLSPTTSTITSNTMALSLNGGLGSMALTSPTSPPTAASSSVWQQQKSSAQQQQQQRSTTDSTAMLQKKQPMGMMMGANGSNTNAMLMQQMQPLVLNGGSSNGSNAAPVAKLSQQDILDFLN